MIIAVTGHRPNKLGGYDRKTFNRLVDLGKAVITKYEPELIYTGMALGWDTAIAVAANDLEVPFFAAIPFAGQESRWQIEDQLRYQQLLGFAAGREVVCEGGYEAWKMQVRNQYMIDRCELLLALWDGTSGGTANAVAYAKKQCVETVNLYSSWRKYKNAR